MSTSFKRAVSKGFTLIELLIVVIILAILAAIVIPQFSNSTSDAKEATLDANLAAMRSAIEQYKIQHGVYPGAVTAVGTCPTGATPGTGAINTSQAVIEQLTMATNAAGVACSVADATFRFGPYVRQAIPNEPINNIGSLPAGIVVSTAGTPLAPSVTTGGWAYDSKSGQIVMNSNLPDSSKAARLYSAH
jgi:general secretion pathway protein G